MKVIVLVKATEHSEAGEPCGLTEMGRFNDELLKAGVLLAVEGLQPSSQSVRVQLAGPDRAVTDGPFAETKELVAGFWLWQVKSMDEAIAWAKRCPNPKPDKLPQLEIRPVIESADFREQLAPALRAQERRIRELPAIKKSP